MARKATADDVRRWVPEMGGIQLKFDMGTTPEEREVERDLLSALDANDLRTGVDKFSRLNVLLMLRTLSPMIATISDENVRMMANEAMLLAYALTKKVSCDETSKYLNVRSIDDLRTQVEEFMEVLEKIETDSPMPEIPFEHP